MAVNITLAAYNFWIKQKQPKRKEEKADYIEGSRVLDSFDGTHDVLPVLKDVLSTLSNINSDSKQNKSILCQKCEIGGRILRGLVKIGEFGVASELIDHRTGALNYQRSADEADMIPLFYLLYAPPGAQSGIMFLQSTQGRGMKSIFGALIDKYFEDHCQGYKLSIDPYYDPHRFLQCIENWRLEEIEYKYHSLPQDLFDGFNPVNDRAGTTSKNQARIASFILKSIFASGAAKAILGEENYEAIKNGRQIKGLISSPSFLGDYDDATFRFSNQGRKVSFSLSEFSNARVIFPVNDDSTVHIDGGTPDYSDIARYACEKLNEICDKMGISKPEKETFVTLWN